MYKLSVNIITHNRANLLKDAINSVLNQTYKDYELIIVDDGSTDNTEGMVKDIKDERIKYHKAKKQNTVNDVRNIALNLSNGKYIALLDDDDIWVDKDKLQKQVDFLDNNPEYILVGTGAIVVNEQGKEKYRFLNPQNDDKIKQNMLTRCFFVNSSTMFKKEIADNIGGYSSKPYSKHIEDYNFWLDLGRHGKLANLPEFSVEYKEQNNQVSNKYRKKQSLNTIRLIKDYKKDYPNYLKAKIRTSLRALLYGYLNMTWLYSLTALFKVKRNK